MGIRILDNVLCSRKISFRPLELLGGQYSYPHGFSRLGFLLSPYFCFDQVHGFGNTTGNFGLLVEEEIEGSNSIFDSCENAGGPFPLDGPKHIADFQVDSMVDVGLLSSCRQTDEINDTGLPDNVLPGFLRKVPVYIES